MLRDRFENLKLPSSSPLSSLFLDKVGRGLPLGCRQLRLQGIQRELALHRSPVDHPRRECADASHLTGRDHLSALQRIRNKTASEGLCIKNQPS